MINLHKSYMAKLGFKLATLGPAVKTHYQLRYGAWLDRKRREIHSEKERSISSVYYYCLQGPKHNGQTFAQNGYYVTFCQQN